MMNISLILRGLNMQTFSLPLKFSQKKIALSALQVILGSLLISFSSSLSLNIPFSPVPLSLQTFAVMLVGLTFGSSKGLLSVLLYLLEGICGLPVFASGSFGLATLLGPTGGYLIGFISQAYFAGLTLEKQSFFDAKKTFLGLFFSSATQLMLGVCYLSLFIGFEKAFILGMLPFIFGEILKITALTSYCKLEHRKKVS